MSYNAEYFTSEGLEALQKEIDLTIDCQEETVQVLIDILLSANNKEQTAHHVVFLNILAKIRLNLGAVSEIMPLLKDDYRFKTSTNLLYRAIIDDLITLYYLLSFVIIPDKEQVSLSNELSLLHKDYLKSCESILNSEAAFKNYLQNLFKDDAEPMLFDANAAIDELRQANPEVFDVGLKRFKKAAEIRHSSHSAFSGKYPIGDGFISESKKIKFLADGGFQRHDVLNYLFKYFSQYQHFSPKMHITMLADNAYDVICYQVTLMELACCMTIFLRILEVDHKELLDQRAHALIERIVTKDTVT